MTAACPQNYGEPFEVFDQNNVSLGRTETRKQVHTLGLFHRSVQVILKNSKGEVLLQRRSPYKDVAPNLWDLSCSEHLTPHETYAAGAARGLREELGLPTESLVRVVPAFLQDFEYPVQKVHDREFVEVWSATSDEALHPDGIEVVEVKWINEQQLFEDMESGHREQYTPWLADSIARYKAALPRS